MPPRIGKLWCSFLTLRGTGAARSLSRPKATGDRYPRRKICRQADRRRSGYFAYVKKSAHAHGPQPLRNAERQSGFSRYVLKASRRRHFEALPPSRMDCFRSATPSAVSTRVCQGMSVAAQEAACSKVCCRSLPGRQRDQRSGIHVLAETQKLIETPWSSSAIPDFLDPLTKARVLRTSRHA